VKNLIFIPARSGSKRLKNKNLINLKNKPLIYYTLEIAKKIKKKLKNTEIIVSSDSNKIINYSNKILKTKNNYKRPKKFATDKTTMTQTLTNLLNSLKNKKRKEPEIIITLQPTSPIRNIKDILKSINILKTSKKIESLVSISKPIEEINNIVIKKKNYQLVSNQKKKFKYFKINGNFYVTRTKFILKKKKIFDYTKLTHFFEIKKNYSFDINEKFDLNLCEKII
jgi:CMP-N,N'-diacetyllegionaminic acid synthase